MCTKKYFAVFATTLLATLAFQPIFSYSEGTVIKPGMNNSNVTELQKDLKTLGFFKADATGYFGDITKTALINFQKSCGLLADGVAGKNTISKIAGMRKQTNTVSRGNIVRSEPQPIPKSAVKSNAPKSNEIQLLPWFTKVNEIYKIGDVATVIDVATGLSIQAKRTYGINHADVEALTANDTAVLKKIAGGSWNWTRRPVIVEIHGYRIAGSLTAMPHAGREDMPANKIVSGRSGGYGKGANLDSVKGNNMDGQFDIHFYGSKTHVSGRVDEEHQNAIQKAYKSGL